MGFGAVSETPPIDTLRSSDRHTRYVRVGMHAAAPLFAGRTPPAPFRSSAREPGIFCITAHFGQDSTGEFSPPKTSCRSPRGGVLARLTLFPNGLARGLAFDGCRVRATQPAPPGEPGPIRTPHHVEPGCLKWRFGTVAKIGRQTALNSQSGVGHDTMDNFADNRNSPLLQITFWNMAR
jgi:hypothetical protein